MNSSARLHSRPQAAEDETNASTTDILRRRTSRGRRKLRVPSIYTCFRGIIGVYCLLLALRWLSEYDDHATVGISDHPLLKGYSRIDQSIQSTNKGRISLSAHQIGVNKTAIHSSSSFPRTIPESPFPSCEDSRSNLLKLDPSRIPTYFPGCTNTTFYGFVFRDLVNRLLPPQWTILDPFVPSSRRNRILVLSSDTATRALQEMIDPAWSSSGSEMKAESDLHRFPKLAPRTRWANDETNLQRQFDYDLGASIAIAAKARGYPVDAVGMKGRTNDQHNNKTLDIFWQKLLTIPTSSTTRSTTNTSRETTKSTIVEQNGALLILFDPPEIGQEDDAFTQKSFISFMQEAIASPVDYVVYRVSMTKNERYGQNASLQLLKSGYQLQILSASHHAVGDNASARPTLRRLKYVPHYGPNTLLFDEATVKQYFSYGQKLSAEFSKRVAAFKDYDKDGNNNGDYPFISYIFATRGLDLAIPSTQEYINLTGMEEADVVLNVDASQIPYRSCHRSGNGRRLAKITWGITNTTGTGGKITPRSLVQVTCPTAISRTLHSAANPPVNRKTYDLWHSGSKPEDSEALCVTCRNPATFVNSKFGVEPSLTCTTRFLPQSLSPEKTKQQNSKQESPSKNASVKNEKTPQNILFIELENVSRERFDKLMPLTKAALLSGGLWPMKNYRASGVPGSANFEPFDLMAGNGTTLWSQLGERGYDVLRIRDSCLPTFESHYLYRNHTFYGAGLNRMFCNKKLVRTRPNCYGGKSAAGHLLDYSVDFIKHHHEENHPWAAFLSFVEGNEDSTMLPGTIDAALSGFVMNLKESVLDDQWEHTMVVLASQNGQSRGAYFNSLKGQIEVVKPVLFLKGPSRQDRAKLILNQNRYVTPYDLHKTIQRFLIGDEDDGTSSALSILVNLPEHRAHCRQVSQINDAFCDFEIDQMTEEAKYVAIASATPPSILSFYADIPKQSRKYASVTMNPSLPERATVSEGCLCATNTDKWFPCNEHPWDNPIVPGTREYFMLVECPGRATHIEIRAVKNPVLVKRSYKKIPKKLYKPLPNIIFLELDSVSVSYANRHFPRTREILQKYRVRLTSQGFKCSSGFCSADFSNRISLAGAHSIPNQVAALSGCLSSDFEHACGHEEPEVNLFCNDLSEPHYGLQMHRVRNGARQIYWCPPQPGTAQRLTPWLFSITDSLGYINFFGEEFCFEGSPYVTQGNVFPAFFADIEPHRAFCRLAEQRIRRQNETVLDRFRWAYERQDQACVDSSADDCAYEKARISLELIEQMWSIYPTRPKMAFLNVLAAHVYNSDWSKLFLMAERYDENLAHFLERMLSRPDLQNTIFVIRSDHGLQRGPMAMDYSLQAEHNRPWTELLIPESVSTLSKKTLFENQERLISGHDIYRTIRSLMYVDEAEEPSAPLAPFDNNWTFDLLSMPIPANRTCRDARVDEQLCREESIEPSFGICNVLDPKQKKFCRDYNVKATYNED